MPFFSLSSPSSGNATQLQGRAVSPTAPATGSILAWSGSSWAPGSGVTGPTGARGDDGARIWSGSGAPATGFGASGDFWVDTVNGRLYGPKADGSWGTPLQLQSGPAGPQGVTGPVSTVPGPTGATGAASKVPGPTGPASTVTGPTGSRGATLLAGDGAPLSNYGSDGDWYIDTVAADFYGPKAGGSWGAPTIDLLAITGPTGAQGAPSTVTGPTGAAGQQRRDTSSNWTSINPTLASGEIGVETNTLRFKVGDGSRAWAALPYAGTTGYSLSATTTNATPTRLSGDSLTLEVGEAWQFEIKLVGRNKKTDATKVWSIRGGIKRGFGGAMQMVGSLDTLTTGTLNGASVEVTPDYPGHALAITVTGPATASVDWQATVFTSEKTSTQQALSGGCTDVDVANYDATADYDDGSCSYSPAPSSPNLVLVESPSEITALDVTVGANSLYPAFDPAIKDYYVATSAAWAGSVSYELTINEDSPISGESLAGRTLQITDGTNYYYVRLLPSNVYPGAPVNPPGEDYVPGYYLTAYTMNGPSSPYYYIFDQYGVPVWYGKTVASPKSLHAGNAANRVFENVAAGSRAILRINSQSVTRAAKNILPSPHYGTLEWEIHEAREISLPLSRKGNVLSTAYDDGFYIQEQSPDGSLVWEWHSKDYFSSTNEEYYHLNSVDVHPTTGNVLISLRNCSAVMCVDFQTKDVLWVLQGNHSPSYGTLQSVAIQSKTLQTKWLTISDEPSVDGFQYVGPRAQHDARWQAIAPLSSGNDVISIFDNQSESYWGFTSSGAGPYARGVVYEIDYASGIAIHRSSVFSESGTTPYMGSYTIVEQGGEFSHAIDFPTQHPSLVEWVGPIDGEKTKVLEVDYSGDLYRIVKVPQSFIRADNLRATCGIDVQAGEFPPPPQPGESSLLLHFDGSNESTSFTDSGPNGLTVMANGNAQISTSQSKFGGSSAYLDGGSSIAVETSAAFAFGTDPLTIDMWVYFTGTLGSSIDGFYLLDFRSANNDGLFAFIIANDGTFYPYFGNEDFGGDGDTIPTNEWAHVAFSFDGTTCRCYCNGVLFRSQAFSAASQPACGVTIGSRYTGSGRFIGYIDELRIVKGTAFFQDDFTPPSSPYTS